ncbi:antimicrobial peptide X precursor-like [Chenopodium quinoa]|uniref:antimicrobial peptide X precursor-like n=1 Tax=Chenopodium quinoa TaxID=63459 RepID=UPI000B777E7A|nr:antimicrobial peptide X precursor-like [Chenopodium quinoa]
MSFKSKIPLFFLFISVLLTSTLAIQLPNHHQDARHELMKCMEHCQTRQDGREKRECIQECHHGYKERQQEEEERARWGGGYDEELLGAMINPSDHDSKEDLEKCQLDCLSEAKRGVVKELECVKKCVEEHKEDRGRHLFDKYDLLEDKSDEVEMKCQLDCLSEAKRGVEKELECVKKCVKEHKEEKRKRRERQRGGHSDDKGSEFERCQLHCVSGAKHTYKEVYECEKKCYDDYFKDPEMSLEMQRGRQSVNKDENNNNDHSDDEHEFKKCLIDCGMGAKHTIVEVYKCEMECVKDYQDEQKRHRESPSGRQYVDKDDTINDDHSDDKHELKKCLIDCALGAKHTVEKVWGCEMKCMKDHPEKRDVVVVNQQDHKKCQRQCWRKSPGGNSSVEYECTTVCRQDDGINHGVNVVKEAKNTLIECLNKCQSQGEGHGCQQRCQKEYQRRHPVLGSIIELTAGLF